MRENLKYKIRSIALLNSSINFVIYYFMSRQFRKTFIEVFGSTCCTKCPRARFLSSTRASGFTKHKVIKGFLGLEIINWFIFFKLILNICSFYFSNINQQMIIQKFLVQKPSCINTKKSKKKWLKIHD